MTQSALRHAPGWMLCLAALAGCTHSAVPSPASGPASVLVVRRGWHIDVGMDVRELGSPLDFVTARFPAAHYVFFGFGDEHYVRSVHHRMPAMLAAIWPGNGVLLVTAIENTPTLAFGAGNVVRVMLTDSQRESLVAVIRSSFATAAGDNLPLKAGPYDDSLYFLSTGKYSGAHTCNTWAAETLRAAGVPIHSRGVVLAGQLWGQVRPLNRAGALAPE